MIRTGHRAQRSLSRRASALAGRAGRRGAGAAVTPKRERDARDDPRERATVVPNTHGTTGMDPLRLVRELDEARAAHPLAALGSQARVGLNATSGASAIAGAATRSC